MRIKRITGALAVTKKQVLDKVLQEFPESRWGEVLDFARFLSVQNEQGAWSRFGRSQLARACGDDEPEYTEADLKPELDR